LIDSGKENSRFYLQNSHLIPYCRQPDGNDDQEEQDQIRNSISEN
jgi:hypothetical protein